MKKYIIITFLISVVLLTGCKKWLDINKDPNVSYDIKINLMLPSIEYDLATDLCLGSSNIGFACAVFTHQITCRDDYDQYGINAQSYANSVYWNDLFAGPGKEIEILIQKGEEQDNLIYAGIGKILKAYNYSQIVDLWGNVPYTEANVKDNFSPKFDNDKDIYKNLFLLINQGIADINNTDSKNVITPGNDDLIYGGETEKWIKFANSLKLKLFSQVQSTDIWNSAEVQALIDENNFISGVIANEDDFMLQFGASTLPENTHPGFGEYTGSQVGTYISPWFFELMMGMNTNIFTGNKDPRIPYYWCRQGRLENTPEYAYLDTLNNTKNLKFVSIYFSSHGINRDASGRATFTLPGIYPVGGKYDDGEKPKNNTDGLGVDDASGVGQARLLTYADVEYTKAELFLLGLATGDDRTAFENALNYSFELVDNAVDKNLSSQIIPKLVNSPEATLYKDSVFAEYDAASQEKKLEIIITQKWIQRFGGSAVDSYTDYRRTGYPVLFNPNADPANGGNFQAEDVPCSNSRDYVVSWPYPQTELDVNINAPAQKNQTTDYVFWDIN